AGQHGQRAETDRAAQEAAPVDVVDQLAVVGENALIDRFARPKQRRSAGANAHVLLCQCDVSISGTALTSGMFLISATAGAGALQAAARGLGGGLSRRGPPVSMASRLCGTNNAKLT